MFQPGSSCRHRGTAPSAGVTLVEILVALTILGLIAAVATPRLIGWMHSQRTAAQRETILQRLDHQSIEAFVNGEVITLDAEHPPPLPDGWQAMLDDTIRFAANGLCSPGTLVLVTPQGTRERYRVRPPECRFRRAQ